MASIYRRRKHQSAPWYVAYTDENGKRRIVRAAVDRKDAEEIARKLESDVALRRRGVLDPMMERLAAAERKPVSEHLNKWAGDLRARGDTAKHVDLFVGRARRLIEQAGIKKLSELSTPTVQEVLIALRAARGDDGTVKTMALGTLNHYRNAARSFGAWLFRNGWLRTNPLQGLAGYNAREDPRHERRTLGIDELRKLIRTAHEGGYYYYMTGPARALVYRLAALTGLRFSEIRSARVASFDLDGPRPTVTILPGYTKNGVLATFALPRDLAEDLRPYLASRRANAPAFDLPDRGAPMLRFDLERAELPYRDDAGRVFDFHSLRCECATLADQAGVTPRVVQRLMRHSSLELSGRYTRPRQVDIDSAIAALPALAPERPASDAPALRATGTDPATSKRAIQVAPQPPDPTVGNSIATPDMALNSGGGTRTPDTRIMIPLL